MIVLDASALVDVILDQPAKPWVLDQILDEAVCAPAHLLAETLSAVARLVRAGDLDVAVAQHALSEAVDLDVELIAPTHEHLNAALGLQERVRVPDALYVALAVERAARLVTTDARLARASLPCDVRCPPAEPREASGDASRIG